MRILIPDAQFAAGPDIERIALPEAEFLIHRTNDPMKIPDAVWSKADAVLVNHEMQVDRVVAAKLTRARLVVRYGAGFDNIDLAACAERGIAVSNVPDYGTEEVANHALAGILSLRRGLPTFTELLAVDPVGGWRWDAAPLVKRLSVQALGIVGLGRIAARRPRAPRRSASTSPITIRICAPTIRARRPICASRISTRCSARRTWSRSTAR